MSSITKSDNRFTVETAEITVLADQDINKVKGDIMKKLSRYKSPTLHGSKGLDFYEADFLGKMLSGKFNNCTEKDFSAPDEKHFFIKYNGEDTEKMKQAFLKLTKA